MTLNLKALMQRRIQTKGFSSKEKKFSPYSEGYKKQRAKAGYQVKHVDITRTGEMWSSIRPEIKSSLFSASVTLRASGALNIKKMAAFVKHRSNPLNPTKKEIDLISNLNKRRILKYIS